MLKEFLQVEEAFILYQKDSTVSHRLFFWLLCIFWEWMTTLLCIIYFLTYSILSLFWVLYIKDSFPRSEYLHRLFFRIDWFNIFAVQGGSSKIEILSMNIIHEQMNKIFPLDLEQMRTSSKPNLQLGCRAVIRKESLKRRRLD